MDNGLGVRGVGQFFDVNAWTSGFAFFERIYYNNCYVSILCDKSKFMGKLFYLDSIDR